MKREEGRVRTRPTGTITEAILPRTRCGRCRIPTRGYRLCSRCVARRWWRELDEFDFDHETVDWHGTSLDRGWPERDARGAELLAARWVA